MKYYNAIDKNSHLFNMKNARLSRHIMYMNIN